MRTGCKSHDPARAALLPSARYGAVLPPASVPLPPWQPGAYDNNDNPTCVPIALAHAARAWSVKFGDASTDITFTIPQIDALYSAATGTPLAEIAASDGSDPLAVVERAQGRGWDIGGQAPLVPDFRVAASTPLAISSGIAHVGAVMLALTLYEQDMEDAQARRPWIAVPAGDPIGGHMVAAAAYDSQRVQLATWGMFQPASWTWLAPRLRLVLVAGWRDLTPPGVDYGVVWGAAA